MTELPSPENANSGTGTPRWVKVFGIIVIVLVLAVLIHYLYGGSHFGRTS